MTIDHIDQRKKNDCLFVPCHGPVRLATKEHLGMYGFETTIRSLFSIRYVELLLLLLFKNVLCMTHSMRPMEGIRVPLVLWQFRQKAMVIHPRLTWDGPFPKLLPFRTYDTK